jgi:hypothetical protein
MLGATLLCILFLGSSSRWPAYVGARTLLYIDRVMPWRVMNFLADAHDRGVLRRVGSVYQFRHVRIKESLASRASSLRNGNMHVSFSDQDDVVVRGT